MRTSEGFGDVLNDLPVLPGVSGRIDRLVYLDDPSFDLRDDAFVLLMQRTRKNDVGVMRRLAEEEVDDREELENEAAAFARNQQIAKSIGIPAIVILGALLIGLVNGIFVTRLRIPSFLVTLGMLLVARGTALQRFPSVGQSIWRMALAPDGRSVLTADHDKLLRVLRDRTGPAASFLVNEQNFTFRSLRGSAVWGFRMDGVVHDEAEHVGRQLHALPVARPAGGIDPCRPELDGPGKECVGRRFAASDAQYEHLRELGLREPLPFGPRAGWLWYDGEAQLAAGSKPRANARTPWQRAHEQWQSERGWSEGGTAGARLALRGCDPFGDSHEEQRLGDAFRATATRVFDAVVLGRGGERA